MEDMNANLDGLGDHLRGAREQRGMSQRELARRLDVSASLISLIEGGEVTAIGRHVVGHRQ